MSTTQLSLGASSSTLTWQRHKVCSAERKPLERSGVPIEVVCKQIQEELAKASRIGFAFDPCRVRFDCSVDTSRSTV